ncbi:RNA-dependent DNA polymerase [candidate division WWE3 bacterium]|jgi:RNA-directed DNA polymerase|nr:RNA-dependent DNA polymerase [candidate division WWE3 bacterium]MBT7350463.1 RNA-dependent DNA polymerase [candidate division WWE3 bacterium]
MTLPAQPDIFNIIASFESLCAAYRRARLGKQGKPKICEFDFYLEAELNKLEHQLKTNQYQPSSYTHFKVREPKLRQVSAPAFRDRVVHHSLVAEIEPLFDKQFIYDSYACRKNKGTHLGAKRVKKFLMAARTKYGKDQPIYALQADIKQFFQSIDWNILLQLINKTITCPQTYDLIEKIITSYKPYKSATPQPAQLNLFNQSHHHLVTGTRVGLPIGNLTSQLFANVYLNQLDHFIKDRLREKYYARYMDDFLIIHPDKEHLLNLQDKIKKFLQKKLKLKLHPKKITIKHAKNGIPFVGYRIFYDHVLIRGNTLRRMQKNYRNKVRAYHDGKITLEKLRETESALYGHFNHADTYGLEQKMFKHNQNLK